MTVTIITRSGRRVLEDATRITEICQGLVLVSAGNNKAIPVPADAIGIEITQ